MSVPDWFFHHNTGDADAGPGRLTALQERKLTVTEQAQAQAVHTSRLAWRRFRAACQHPGGFVHGLMSQKPPSVAEQVAYTESRAWVTPGHDGGGFDVAGTAYQRLFGINGVAYHDAMAAVYQKPYRMGCYLVGFTLVEGVTIRLWGWVVGLAIYLLLRVIVFPVVVTVLRPKGSGR